MCVRRGWVGGGRRGRCKRVCPCKHKLWDNQIKSNLTLLSQIEKLKTWLDVAL
jgi:hypothetical protein